MRIPDETIEEIRRAADIVDVVSAVVRLKKRGKSYVGLCPFHQEKTPSFTVSAEKQMFHCFGCGAGGNVFTFIMQTEKVSFVEAVRTLAERAGIRLPTREGPQEGTEHEALYDACRRAGIWFHDTLMSSGEGKIGLEYLRHRGFADETIRRFGLGYAPNAWDSLLRFAGREGINTGVLERAGLTVRRDEGEGWYDRFRGRVMFPIFSTTGRTIAFGARKVREDDPLAKYLNSPETPIYTKSRVLYGLSHAREAIRGREYAVLVEGYIDLISLVQSGCDNVVASSGTALTEDHAKLLARYTGSVVIVYDADSAGSKATLRGVDILLEQGLDVRVAPLPQGEDPDSFIRSSGYEAFRKLLEDAVSFLDFKTGLLQAQGKLSDPERQTRAIRSIVETIALMRDELKRNLYVKFLAEKYGLYESVLFRELERQTRGKAHPAARSFAPGGAEPAPAQTGPARPSGPVPAAERDLLKVLLEHGPDLTSEAFGEITPEVFSHPVAQATARLLVSRGVDAGGIHELLPGIEDEEVRRFVTEALFSRYDISKVWEEMGSGVEEPDPRAIMRACLDILHIRAVDDRLAEEFRALKIAEARGESLGPHRQRIIALQEEKKRLRASPGEGGAKTAER